MGDFQSNVPKYFQKLRNENDFFDVTLVSDDQKQVMAHKVVLSSCSEYFKNILQANKHSHPMLCMTGITSIDLENILDYFYHGEVQIFQGDIDRFLDISQRLKLDGLLENLGFNIPILPDESEEPESTENENDSTINTNAAATITKQKNSMTSFGEIEQKVKEYLRINENGERICNICGKISTGPNRIRNMKYHIETHLEGICVSCSSCGKQF